MTNVIEKWDKLDWKQNGYYTLLHRSKSKCFFLTHLFVESVPLDAHLPEYDVLHDLPGDEALDGEGEQDRHAEQKAAEVHQAVGPAVVVQEIA